MTTPSTAKSTDLEIYVEGEVQIVTRRYTTKYEVYGVRYVMTAAEVREHRRDLLEPWGAYLSTQAKVEAAKKAVAERAAAERTPAAQAQTAP